jgi:hypothetical protein
MEPSRRIHFSRRGDPAPLSQPQAKKASSPTSLNLPRWTPEDQAAQTKAYTIAQQVKAKLPDFFNPAKQQEMMQAFVPLTGFPSLASLKISVNLADYIDFEANRLFDKFMNEQVKPSIRKTLQTPTTQEGLPLNSQIGRNVVRNIRVELSLPLLALLKTEVRKRLI